jgi:hypothetical protein
MNPPTNTPPLRPIAPSFDSRPLPSIARSMSRGVSAEMAMLLHLATINRHQHQLLGVRKRETLRPF